MPQIPAYLTQQQLPSAGGMPNGVVATPVVGQPGQAPGAGDALLDQAVAGTAQALQQAGQLGLHAEQIRLHEQELAAHQQKAFDVLNGAQALQKYRLGLDPLYDQEKEDWQNLPKNFRDKATEMKGEYSKGLTPYAKALFEKDADEQIVIWQHRAFEETSTRRKQTATFQLTTEMQFAQKAYAEATNDYERSVALGHLSEMAQRGVEAGFYDGAAAATAVQNTVKATQVDRFKALILTEPDVAERQLLAQTKGQPTDPAVPLAPPELVGDLLKETAVAKQHQLSRADAAQHRADYQFGKTQEANAADIRARLSELLPIPENVGKLNSLLAEVNRRSQGEHPEIDGRSQAEFDNHIRTFKAAAMAPRTADDKPTEDAIIRRIDAASNEVQYEEARRFVVQSAGLMKSDSTKKYLDQIYERKNAGHYLNLPNVREGFRIIEGATVGQSAYNAMQRSSNNEVEAAHKRDALDAYRSGLRQIAEGPQGNRDQANAQAQDLARAAREKYIDSPQQEARRQRMPLPLISPDGRTPLKDPEQVKAIISDPQKMPGLSLAERQREFDQWYEWFKKAFPTGVTPTTGTGAVPGGTYERTKEPQR